MTACLLANKGVKSTTGIAPDYNRKFPECFTIVVELARFPVQFSLAELIPTLDSASLRVSLIMKKKDQWKPGIASINTHTGQTEERYFSKFQGYHFLNK